VPGRMARKLGTHIKSNLVGYLALFVALGGTSYAAIKLPAGSVGTKQLQSNAVTSGKVKNRSLRVTDLAPGTLRRGPRGAQGPAGPAGSLAGSLPSGKTVRGRWAVGGTNPDTAPGDITSDAFSFGAQLPSAPKRVFVFGASGGAECPGSAESPDAAPGVLCIYVEYQININNGIETIIGTTPGATSRQGAEIYIVNASSTPGGYGARGSWAATAP